MSPTPPTTLFRVQTLGAGVDRIAAEAIDKDLLPPSLQQTLASGWQTVSYRQNTELAVEAWHWNPQGTWSDRSGDNDKNDRSKEKDNHGSANNAGPAGKGYFTGSATPTENLRYSYGYALPRRGFTRNDGTDNSGFSRLTDGDLNTFWKSNPYLAQHFTGESDALHPQWIVLDLAQSQPIDSIRIAWAEPYATRLLWCNIGPAMIPCTAPTRGVWQTFPQGAVDAGKRRIPKPFASLPLTRHPVRFIRIWMTESSNSCAMPHGFQLIRVIVRGLCDPRDSI